MKQKIKLYLDYLREYMQKEGESEQDINDAVYTYNIRLKSSIWKTTYRKVHKAKNKF